MSTEKTQTKQDGTSKFRKEIYQRAAYTETVPKKSGGSYVKTVNFGVFVARKSNKGELRVGFSVVHPDDDAKFDLKRGLNIARRRTSTSLSPRLIRNPEMAARFELVRPQYERFIARAVRYFNLEKTVEAAG